MKNKECKVCHEWKAKEQFRPPSRKTCNACAAKKRRERRLANLEQERATAKQYRETHQEEIAKHKAQYQSTVRGRELMLAAGRRYRHTDKGMARSRAQSARWGKTKKGRLSSRIRCARRRARLLNAPGVFTAKDWHEILRIQQNKCFYCNKTFSESLPTTMDHVIPLSKGGSHDPKNIVAACRSCNSKKHVTII